MPIFIQNMMKDYEICEMNSVNPCLRPSSIHISKKLHVLLMYSYEMIAFIKSACEPTSWQHRCPVVLHLAC